MARIFLVASVVLVALTGAMARTPLIVKTTDESTCNVCLTAVRVMSDLLCDPGTTDFLMKMTLEDLCPALGQQEDQCRQFAEALLPVAIEWLRSSATPASMCASVGVCPQAALADPELHRARFHRSDNADCGLCQFVVRHTKAMHDHVAITEADTIKAWTREACDHLPMEFNSDCVAMVAKRGDLFATTLRSKLPVQEVCAASGYCNAGLMSIKPAPFSAPLVASLAAVHQLQTGYGSSLATTSCDSCKLTVLEMHMLLDNPTIQADIQTYVKTMCTGMFPNSADTCASWVDLYAPLIFQQLDAYIQPDPICQAIHMCVPPSTASLVKAISEAVMQRAVGNLARLAGFGRHGIV